MDYKLKPFHYFLSMFAALLISGCDTESSPEPLEILGTPPDSLYYDSEFAFTFGVSGGDGVLRYRYIQNPEDEEERDSTFEENPVEMTIEVVDGEKPSFILRALPQVPEGTSFEELTNQTFTYEIEVTDGINTVKEEYEFTLKKNRLNFLADLSINESSVNNSVVDSLNAQLAVNNTSVCNQVQDDALTKNINSSGETVYPYAFQVVTDTRTASPVEIFYRFTTSYQDSVPERADRNISHARPGVDYVDAVRSIILEPNKARCLAYIDMLDDSLFEGTETVTIEFFKTVGGAIDLSEASRTIDIRDNEIKPEYTTSKIVRNRGDKVVVPITISRAVDFPISVNVSVGSETTATESDFLIEPQGGVVTLTPGETQASYTVTLLDNPNQNVGDVKEDKVISIITDIDKILDVDPFTIDINEWGTTSNITNEVVAEGSAIAEAIDFAISDDGIMSVLIKDTKDSSVYTNLKLFNRDASDFGALEFSKIGLDISPVSIEPSINNDGHRLSIIFNVNGLYADVFRGASDFVVMNLTRDDVGGAYSIDSVKQYGSEGNDIVTGSFVLGSTLYVYGNTTGSDFEGSPTSETNSGGKDGFLYAINLTTNTFNWARLFGTSNEDSVESIDVGNRDIVVAISSKNTDEDVFIRKINTSTGEDRVEENSVSISSNSPDLIGGIEFDKSASSFRVLLDSDSDLSVENGSTESLTRDVQLLTFNAENEASGSVVISTDFDDLAHDLVTMPDNLNLIVAGETYGELEGNLKRGSVDLDLFITLLGLENSSNIMLNNNIQFGTTSDDSIVAVKPASDTKFFVLWKELFSNPATATYRLSAFSVDGRKLSRDP